MTRAAVPRCRASWRRHAARDRRAPARRLRASRPPAAGDLRARGDRRRELDRRRRLRAGADRARPIASTTKLMTALLSIRRARLDETFAAAPYEAHRPSRGSTSRDGEQLTVRDLLRGLLLASANDAAVTLAEGVAGSEAAFVRLMNREARRLGLRGTAYSDPIGLETPATTRRRRDLARLAILCAAAPSRAARWTCRGPRCGPATACAGSSTATCSCARPVGQRRQDRLYRGRGLRARGLGAEARGQRGERGARRAQRGGALPRHARAAALGPEALQRVTPVRRGRRSPGRRPLRRRRHGRAGAGALLDARGAARTPGERLACAFRASCAVRSPPGARSGRWSCASTAAGRSRAGGHRQRVPAPSRVEQLSEAVLRPWCSFPRRLP